MASPGKSKTKVGTLDCFDLFVKEWANYVKIRQCYSMEIVFTLLNRPNAMLKKALLWDEDRNQIEHRTGFLQFYVKTKKVCRCFASFSSEQEHFTHVIFITALIRPSDVKNRTDHVLWRNTAKVFRRCSSYAIALVVTSRSSSFEYTMSVHAVHKLAHLTPPHSKFSPPRPPQPLAQPFAQMR